MKYYLSVFKVKVFSISSLVSLLIILSIGCKRSQLIDRFSLITRHNGHNYHDARLAVYLPGNGGLDRCGKNVRPETISGQCEVEGQI